jgi:8-oxo-dGTP pyrophosphatase MutT (NUDIX family)
VLDPESHQGMPVATAKPSAVLAVLFEEYGEARVLLTRRSSRLRNHTGEVAFPGGRLEPGEEALAAALREAAEEVGLDPNLVEIIGELSPLATLSSGSAITPFVGIVEQRPVLHPNPAEVELAFDVALADLLADGIYWEERWQMGGLGERAVHFFALGEDVVWGATGRMLRELLDLVTVVPG